MIAPTRELLASRDLFVTLVVRQLRIRRKQSRLAIAWPVATPFVLAALYTVVFKRVVDVPIDRYPQFLLAGLLPWGFVSTAINRALPSLSLEPDLVRKARFPYALLPLSAVAAHAVTFGVSLAGFVGFLVVRSEAHVRLLPLLVLPTLSLLVFTGAIVMLLALADVYNHDLRHVIGNLLPIWFFLLPIVYRPRMAPGYIQALQRVDPMAAVVGQFRAILHHGRLDDPAGLLGALAACVGLFVVAAALFDRGARNLAKAI